MRVSRVDAHEEELLDATSPSWDRADAEEAHLAPSPLGMQPSQWIQGAFARADYGNIQAAKLRALQNGHDVAVRVEWAVPRPVSTSVGSDEFPDACAIMIPFVRGAPVMTMGSRYQWVNMWLWRADGLGPMAVTAAGLGTTQRIDDGVVKARGVYQNGRWKVAFVRALDPGRPRDHVPLQPGVKWPITLALWEGAKRERAGLKSIAEYWMDLEL